MLKSPLLKSLPLKTPRSRNNPAHKDLLSVPLRHGAGLPDAGKDNAPTRASGHFSIGWQRRGQRRQGLKKS